MAKTEIDRKLETVELPFGDEIFTEAQLAIIDPADTIMIVPCPSGYMLMNSPVGDDDPRTERFVCCTSAGDVLYYLLDVYEHQMNKRTNSIIGDCACDVIGEGRIDPSGIRKLVSQLNAAMEGQNRAWLSIGKAAKQIQLATATKPKKKNSAKAESPSNVADSEQPLPNTEKDVNVEKKDTAKSPKVKSDVGSTCENGPAKDAKKKPQKKEKSVSPTTESTTGNTIGRVKRLVELPKTLSVGFICKGCGEIYYNEQKQPQLCTKCTGGGFEALTRTFVKLNGATKLCSSAACRKTAIVGYQARNGKIWGACLEHAPKDLFETQKERNHAQRPESTER
jgi:hypothetical protein